jgi:hypothetical protein
MQNVVWFPKYPMPLQALHDSINTMCAKKGNMPLPPYYLSSAQIRAARSLIRWTADDLAQDPEGDREETIAQSIRGRECCRDL